jgi:hypothetical protein
MPRALYRTLATNNQGTMSLTIRERGTTVFQSIQGNPNPAIQAIASATGIPKSSVHRHQQAIQRRAQYPESEWWETEAGSAWLKRLVVGSLFFFGIKHGIGVGEVSQFLKALRLDLHVGCSPSALAGLKHQLKDTIEAYGTAQAEHCQPKAGQGICVGGDEVFFGLPVLVLAELASGYLFTEVQCEDRRYETWKEQIQSWWSQAGWECHFMVSDRAKALIKLATEGLGCVSVADWFHALRSLGQPIGRALGRQQARVAQQRKTLTAQREATPRETKRVELDPALAELSTQADTLGQDHQRYHQAMATMTFSLHPFHLDTQAPQTVSDITPRLQSALTPLRDLGATYGGQKAAQAIQSFEQHLPDLVRGLQAWWHWALQSLAAQTPSIDVQNWVLGVLLPWVYWQQQTDKTHHPDFKARYQQAANEAAQQLVLHPLTQSMAADERQSWIDWARWMANNYQRTSSAVEGRNGYLTRLHHAGRGFSPQTLKILTIIHNFHLQRPDGTTAAQRLFGHNFPNLFEWVVDQMGDLPRARRSLKAQRPNPFHLEGFPA